MNFDDLKAWAEVFVPSGYTQARRVLELLAAYEEQRALCVSLAQRVIAQSECLSRAAERREEKQQS